MNRLNTYKIQSEKPIENTQEDSLGYDAFAKRLAELLLHAESSSFIGLHAPWGSGKTSLLHLIKLHIENNNNTQQRTTMPLIFDAWDYESPHGMIPKLFTEIANQIPNEAAKNSWLKVASAVALGIADVALSTLSNELLSVEKVVSNLKELDEHFDIQQSMVDRSYLSNYFDQIFSQALELTARAECNHIVLLIDDLDRCHPDNIFTFIDHLRRLVALIERKRTTFNNYPSFVGLIAFDRKVISSSILAKYPTLSTNPIDYLLKLTNLIVQLPLPEKNAIEKLCNQRLNENYQTNRLNGEIKNTISNTLSTILIKERGKISLRQALTVIRQIGFAQENQYKIDNLSSESIKSIISATLLGIVEPECFEHLKSIETHQNKRQLTLNALKDLQENPTASDSIIAPLYANTNKDKNFWNRCSYQYIIKQITLNPSSLDEAHKLLGLT